MATCNCSEQEPTISILVDSDLFRELRDIVLKKNADNIEEMKKIHEYAFQEKKKVVDLIEKEIADHPEINPTIKSYLKTGWYYEMYFHHPIMKTQTVKKWFGMITTTIEVPNTELMNKWKALSRDLDTAKWSFHYSIPDISEISDLSVLFSEKEKGGAHSINLTPKHLSVIRRLRERVTIEE